MASDFVQRWLDSYNSRTFPIEDLYRAPKHRRPARRSARCRDQRRPYRATDRGRVLVLRAVGGGRIFVILTVVTERADRQALIGRLAVRLLV